MPRSGRACKLPRERRGASIERGAAFGVEIGEYRGVVRVTRRVFQRLLPERPTPSDGSGLLPPATPGSRASASESCAGAS
jgi:hypothetical protein